MDPSGFQALCIENLAKGPDISTVDPWQNGGHRPNGLLITFTSGARLWVAVTTSAGTAGLTALSDDGDPPAVGPLPPLYDSESKITPVRAERYLVAVLRAADPDELAQVYGYTERASDAKHPGVGVVFAAGGRGYLPLAMTASAERRPPARSFDYLQEQF